MRSLLDLCLPVWYKHPRPYYTMCETVHSQASLPHVYLIFFFFFSFEYKSLDK